MVVVDIEELVNWKEIAAHLRVSITTARRWRDELELPVYRVGGQVRADKEDLRKWMGDFRRKK